MAYAVSTPVFEGPLDVLLHLITKQQVELYDVSISAIVDGFLAHLDELGRVTDSGPVDLELVTEFLLIAATLVELKTRRLLPGSDTVDLDDEFALWEERDLLLARLVECKTFKDAAVALVAMEDAARLSYPRTAGLEQHFADLTPDLLVGLPPERLRAAYLRAIRPKPEPPRVSLDHVTPVRITVQEVVEQLGQVLPRLGRSTFRQLTAKAGERMEVIVHFLGLLELYKQGLVDLEQAVTFGELEVTWMGGASDVDSVVVDLRARVLADHYEG